MTPACRSLAHSLQDCGQTFQKGANQKQLLGLKRSSQERELWDKSRQARLTSSENRLIVVLGSRGWPDFDQVEGRIMILEVTPLALLLSSPSAQLLSSLAHLGMAINRAQQLGFCSLAALLVRRRQVLTRTGAHL